MGDRYRSNVHGCRESAAAALLNVHGSRESAAQGTFKRPWMPCLRAINAIARSNRSRMRPSGGFERPWMALTGLGRRIERPWMPFLDRGGAGKRPWMRMGDGRESAARRQGTADARIFSSARDMLFAAAQVVAAA
jgi:hypothetical protein